MLTFQELINRLNKYWAEYGCTILQPYTTEMGAGTLHPATALRAIDSLHYKIAYVQPSIRPADGRFGKNPNRLYQHHQYQVILKPSPDNMQELYLKSLEEISINIEKNDIRFVNDDWENPSIGAAGTGWEIWHNGIEISQFTYMQQVGGILCPAITGELTYGLERICTIIQNKDSIYDLMWSENMSYKQIFKKQEEDFSNSTYYHNNDEKYLLEQFKQNELKALTLIKNNLPVAAYDQCLKASHNLNLLDANGNLSTQERAQFILKIRNLTNKCCGLWAKYQENPQ
ncbi:glycine--tRNA ligase subunit alpha [Candidatus Xenohaliotis californiensis]|uniref:Glycine--tRNA ligase alpha subunit n=1 Tax=Candidatus Xenohaliotis californiensis TaxID=84677 RepID=A0ABM9N9J4_9RICK|nr:glycine--tRNA ligase subunit alpha [Candidatus Xenohaliotis californiensis]